MHTQRYAGKNFDQICSLKTTFALSWPVTGSTWSRSANYMRQWFVQNERPQSSFKHQRRSMKQGRWVGCCSIIEFKNWGIFMARNGLWQPTVHSIPRPTIWMGPFRVESFRNMLVVQWFYGNREKKKEGWHEEEDHTNNTGGMKAMLAAHMFIHYFLKTVLAGGTIRVPVQRLRDVQKVMIPGHEWLNPIPNLRTVWFHSWCFDRVIDKFRTEEKI